MNKIVQAAEQSQTLVQLELVTTSRRTSTRERIASLNTRLRAADFEQERQSRKHQLEMHAMRCRRRALVHQQAREVAAQALSTFKPLE